MGKFKIFYSWQSDLPGSKTRNFIRECIDEAIELAEETEAIDAERDEATKGVTGSPNIVTTIFSKIDDCDLFIADLSLCFIGSENNQKKSPNPNVLLELGYAVKTLGWERVICLCNIDYGSEYPFDIAHNRITNYSFQGKTRKEVMVDISKIIFINIRELRKLNPRIKKGVASHIIGTYDFKNKIVNEKLIPIKIDEQEGYKFHNQELLLEIQNLYKDIQNITSKIIISRESDTYNISLTNLSDSINNNVFDQVNELDKKTESPIIWEDYKSDAILIKRWLGYDVSDEFFNLGDLKHVVQKINLFNSAPELHGTEYEKDKYNKLTELSYKLTLLNLRNEYLKTFDGMKFIPLAIKNVSTILDEDIRIVVNVEEGEIINPDETLIWKDIDGLRGELCREDDGDVGIICELFYLKEDGVIQIEDIPYDPTRYLPKMPIFTANGLCQQMKNEKDYALELQEFIAYANANEYYEFNVKSLRPGECRWLCTGMLIKPVNENIRISYQIHSKYSSGELNGILEI